MTGKDAQSHDEWLEENFRLAKTQTSEWAKKENAELKYQSPDGSIEIYQFGKSKSRRLQTFYYRSAIDTHWQGIEPESIEKEAIKAINFASRRLLDDYNISPASHKGYCNTLFRYLTSTAKGFPRYKSDDPPALLAEIIMYAEQILDKSNSEEFRLWRAFLLGQRTMLHDFYRRSSEDNQKKARQPRNPLITAILDKLARKEDAKAEESWEEFKNQLRNDIEVDFEDKTTNLHNKETWEVEYKYSVDGIKETKSHTMKYSTFKEKLSKARKKFKR